MPYLIIVYHINFILITSLLPNRSIEIEELKCVKGSLSTLNTLQLIKKEREKQAQGVCCFCIRGEIFGDPKLTL